ncbi:unnamed protein product [Lactuca saligna]|uniref:CTP synthase N-terminal domain-containing protein n=1 Tax=Lactuca saligna TaxID=75948 RepID=A0AA36DZS8_LACSI|nr:unnamed protein product [Lactuca saligna]
MLMPGDIESMPFIEALGQFSYRFGAGNFCLIHVSLVSVLNIVGEQKKKTNPTQCSWIKKLGEYVERSCVCVCVDDLLLFINRGDEGTDCNDANIWCCQFLKNIIVWKVVDTPNPMGSKSKRAEYKVVPVCGLDWMGMKELVGADNKCGPIKFAAFIPALMIAGLYFFDHSVA